MHSNSQGLILGGRGGKVCVVYEKIQYIKLCLSLSHKLCPVVTLFIYWEIPFKFQVVHECSTGQHQVILLQELFTQAQFDLKRINYLAWRRTKQTEKTASGQKNHKLQNLMRSSGQRGTLNSAAEQKNELGAMQRGNPEMAIYSVHPVRILKRLY